MLLPSHNLCFVTTFFWSITALNLDSELKCHYLREILPCFLTYVNRLNLDNNQCETPNVTFFLFSLIEKFIQECILSKVILVRIYFRGTISSLRDSQKYCSPSTGPNFQKGFDQDLQRIKSTIQRLQSYTSCSHIKNKCLYGISCSFCQLNQRRRITLKRRTYFSINVKCNHDIDGNCTKVNVTSLESS